MATNFPNSLDAFTNPTASDTLASVPHASQHADANDAIEALETKVGINSATSTSTLEVRAPSIVTSSTRPTGVSGRLIYETDTKRHMVYVDGSEQWQPLAPRTGYKNAIINGDFRVNQRAFTSSTTTSTYGFDRWRSGNSGGTVTMSSQAFTVGSPAETGYESANFLRLVSASQSLSSHFASIAQPMEDVRTFAGTTIVVSFWAKAASGTPKVAIDFTQSFGTGGSPSADVNIYAGQVTLSTSWARYSVSVAIPSISGKTIGTTVNTSSLIMNLWTSAGSTYNSRTGSLGIQNITVDFWGIQIERGSTATDLEQRSYGIELSLCRRYFQRINHRLLGMWTTATTCRFPVISAVEMRVAVHTASLTTTTPYAEQYAIAAVTGSGSTATIDTAYTGGVDVVISGFSGRTQGQIAMFGQGQLDISAEFA